MKNPAELVAEGETVKWMATEEGTVEYTPPFGEPKQIRKFYYGYLPEDEAGHAEALRWVEKEYAPLELKR